MIRRLFAKKYFRFSVGALCIISIGMLFIYINPNEYDKTKAEVEAFNKMSRAERLAKYSVSPVIDHTDIERFPREQFRIQQKKTFFILGYETERYSVKTKLERTFVSFDDHPLLLNFTMTRRNLGAGVDLVRMDNGIYFICQHNKNDSCWRVIRGYEDLPASFP